MYLDLKLLLELQKLSIANLSPEETDLLKILSKPAGNATFNFETVEKMIQDQYPQFNDCLATIFADQKIKFNQLFPVMPYPMIIFILYQLSQTGAQRPVLQQVGQALMVCSLGIKINRKGRGGTNETVEVDLSKIGKPEQSKNGTEWLRDSLTAGKKKKGITGRVCICILLGVLIFFVAAGVLTLAAGGVLFVASNSDKLADRLCVPTELNSFSCKAALELNWRYWRWVTDPETDKLTKAPEGFQVGKYTVSQEDIDLFTGALTSSNPSDFVKAVTKNIHKPDSVNEKEIDEMMEKYGMTRSQAFNFLIGTQVTDGLFGASRVLLSGLTSKKPLIHFGTTSLLQFGLAMFAPESYDDWARTGCLADLDTCYGVKGLVESIYEASKELPGSVTPYEISLLQIKSDFPERVNTVGTAVLDVNSNLSFALKNLLDPVLDKFEFIVSYLNWVPYMKKFTGPMSLPARVAKTISVTSHKVDYVRSKITTLNEAVDLFMILAVAWHTYEHPVIGPVINPTLHKINFENYKGQYVRPRSESRSGPQSAESSGPQSGPRSGPHVLQKFVDKFRKTRGVTKGMVPYDPSAASSNGMVPYDPSAASPNGMVIYDPSKSPQETLALPQPPSVRAKTLALPQPRESAVQKAWNNLSGFEGGKTYKARHMRTTKKKKRKVQRTKRYSYNFF